MKLPNLTSRILTGAVFVSVLLGSITYNKYSFLAVFTGINILALHEFYGLIEKSTQIKINRFCCLFAGTILFFGTFLYFSETIHSLIVFTPFVLTILYLFVAELYAKHPNPILTLSYSIIGLAYVAIPFSILNYLAFRYEMGIYHSHYLFALFMLIWINDSFAYIFGSWLGKHRLFERISPKKSWEGFVGGTICTLFASSIFAHYFTNLSLWGWIGFALLIICFGTWGDLIESLIKRTLGVKDSGSILPGHGGILDRFDSMIFAIPSLFVYLELIRHFIH